MSADAQLASYVDRVLRLKEEADNIAGDVREVYAEAKASGYDKTQLGNLVTYLRKRAKDDDIAEKEAIFETYLTAYMRAKGEIGTRVATHAHAPEPLLTKAAGQGGGAAEPSASRPVPPETANELVGGLPVAAAPFNAEKTGRTPAYAQGAGMERGIDQGVTGGESAATNPVQAAMAVKVEAVANADAEPEQGVQISRPCQTLSRAEGIKRLRPHCQFPERCGSSGGKNHCWPCRKAAGVAA